MRKFKQTSPFILFFIVLTVLVGNNGFFWDSIVLGSGYGHWYYTTDFKYIFVPDDLAGYPPLFGFYVAIGWKLLGKTLLVSHLRVLPFLIGIVLQVQSLVSRYTPQPFHFWVILLLLIEPTFLAQATQIAPDIVLVFLYLFALNSILTGKRIYLALILIALAMLSPRGTIMVVALYLTDLLFGLLSTGNKLTDNYLFSKAIAYLPAFFATCIWLYLHYEHFGWIFYNKESTWGKGSEIVSFVDFFKNILVIGWRFADFGKVIVLLLLTLSLINVYISKQLKRETIEVLLMLLMPLLILSSLLVFFQNPIAHRYFIVVFMLLIVLFGHLLQFLPKVKRLTFYCISVISLLAGHYVVALYPDWMSKGWDATLAHLPYYQLREKMIDYITVNDIPIDEVGSAYPNLRTFKLTDLVNSSEKFAEKDLKKHEYIFYSNVFNDFSDHELDELNSKWTVKKEFKKELVVVRLYQKETK
ncbi:hypothetical protein [uncultured Pontibacter sp.]|uniref:hypothetical protein n=1 Tax=uncultured Pontibacter sp. TaxID=453356 RepID=UPI0026040AA5|nr:hypothetical protein [uncultured Pontibacter sp.]